MTPGDDSENPSTPGLSVQAMALRGAAHLAAGELVEAIECCETALRVRPGYPAALLVMGRVCLASERVEQGMNMLLMAAQGAPRNPDIVEAIVHGLSLQGRWKDAAALGISALKAHPDGLSLHLQVGRVLSRQGRWSELKERLLPFVPKHPGDADLRALLARAFKGLGQRVKAIQVLREALAQVPDHLDSLFQLGVLLNQGRQLEESEHLLRRVLELRPDFTEGARMLANNLSLQGAQEQAIEVLDAARTHSPDAIGLTWLRLSAIPEVFASEEDVQRCRSRFLQDLDDLERQVMEGKGSPEEICTMFAMHYMESNALEFQRRIGAVVSRVMKQAWPQYSRPIPLARVEPGERIRVGVVSSHFRPHTVEWLFRGWIRGLNRDQFEVVCYSVERGLHRPSPATVEAADAFVRVPPRLGPAAARIAQDSPHVILYPEIGMEGFIFRLAALRLAPVQCLSWGHPVTTGLESMDYFLTSDAMEPHDGQAQYSESLVRLPGLSVELDSPLEPEPAERSDFGLPDPGLIYLAGQSLQKYRPEHDALYARILRALPGSRIAWLQSKRIQNTERFRRRIEAALRTEGVDPEGRTLFLPRTTASGFLQLLSACDVYLDTPGWSGGKTSLEAIFVGIPPVTWPGCNMRSRHTFAMLQELGCTELIAHSADEYVHHAVRLGEDAAFRAQQRQRLLQQGPQLFDNPRSTRALEDWLRGLIGSQGELQDGSIH